MRIKTSVWIIVLLIVLAVPIVSAKISCTVTNTTNCGSGTFVLYVKNDTGGWGNAHAQNDSIATYPYGICCSDDAGQTLSAGCGLNSAIFLKLAATDNSHVEVFNQSNYAVNECISVTNRNVSCTYAYGSCSAGYSCIASVASSEASASNLTNDHIDGNCTSTYSMDICCGYSNRPPTINSILLNSTSTGNYTTLDNLTLYFTSSDSDLDSIYNFTDWRVNGTSIAVLDMPFDANVSSVSAGAVIDYSTFGNNGQLGGGTAANAPNWTNNGKVGGAYTFDGIHDYITIPDATNLKPPNTFTISVWVYPVSNVTNQGSVAATIVGKSGYSTGYRITYSNTTAKVTFEVGNGSGVSTSSGISSTSILPLNTWTFIAATFDLNAGVQKLYINGVLNGNKSNIFNYTPSNSNTVRIGYDNGAGNTAYFNGTIDEVRIYNRSLSAEEIYQDYLAGLTGNSTNILVSNDTKIGDIWSALAGSCDGQACTTSVSNNVTINSRIPGQITLVSPTNGNNTLTSRQPPLIWNSDSLASWYELNLTSNNCAGTYTNNTNNGASTSNYSITQALCIQTEGGSNTYYNWTVRACSPDTCGAWSNIWNFSITPYLAITLTSNNVSFGSLLPGAQANTTNLSITPFTFQNDGNVYSNMTNATINQTLWSGTGAGLGTNYFQLEAGQTNETGSFNTTLSTMNWINANSTNPGMINMLYYNDVNDSAYVHVKIIVPGDEPPVNKTTYITFNWQ